MELNTENNEKKHDVNHNIKEFFKIKKPFIAIKEEVMAIRNKYPTKIPIIVEKYDKEKDLPYMDKSKFLVPQEVTMSQFLVIIRNRIKIKPNQALYLIINNKSMLSMSLTMAQAYKSYGNEDGFLYITYASQEVFGNQDDMPGPIQQMQAIKHRFPNKIPLYIQRSNKDKELPDLDINKYLVPRELTMSQFLYILKAKMELRDSQALVLLVNERMMLTHSAIMVQVYDQFRSEDGFLYITYAKQEIFG